MRARPLIATVLSLPALIAGAALTCVHAATQPTAERCWADWSTAAPVVHRESLRPAKDVRALTAQANSGQLLNITLCEHGGRFVYRLLILRAGGTVEALTVDARSPFGK